MKNMENQKYTTTKNEMLVKQWTAILHNIYSVAPSCIRTKIFSIKMYCEKSSAPVI